MKGEETAEFGAVRSVLFVCLGNICRSPLAHGVFEHLLTAAGRRSEFLVESCGIGAWHVGSAPDPRAIAVAAQNGVQLNSRARQVNPITDFERFHLILPMDRRNHRSLIEAGCPPARVRMFLSFAPEAIARKYDAQVPDPYDGGPTEFEEVFRLVHAGATGLLEAIGGSNRSSGIHHR